MPWNDTGAHRRPTAATQQFRHYPALPTAVRVFTMMLLRVVDFVHHRAYMEPGTSSRYNNVLHMARSTTARVTSHVYIENVRTAGYQVPGIEQQRHCIVCQIMRCTLQYDIVP